MAKMKQGLRNTPPDERDFKLGSITSLPVLSELPKEFKLKTLGVKDQKDTDFCSGFAVTLMSEVQEGVELSPEWHFAKSKELSNDKDEWGQDLRTALKVSVNYGDIRQKDAPYSLKDKDDSFLRDIKNWGISDTLAIGQRKKSYFKVKGQYDSYDDVRATIYKTKTPVIMGLNWSWGLDDYILSGASDEGFGHAITVIGWNDKGLILQNSADINAGKEGEHILPREEANYFIDKYGAYTFIDLSPQEARIMIEKNIKLEQLNVINKALILISILIKKLNENIKSFGEIMESIFSTKN
jgi:hypothetical protein